MTDPWSVQGTNNVILQVNSTDEHIEVNTNNQLEVRENDSQTLGFEDSFIQDNNSNILDDTTVVKETSVENLNIEHRPLPDSESYLKGLEHKLEKLKKSSKLVEALSEKRDDCLRSMLQNDSTTNGYNNDLLLELETSITNSDSAVQNLYRQIQPVQPVTVGETVHIVKYDQLEEQRLDLESAEATAEEDDLPASQ